MKRICILYEESPDILETVYGLYNWLTQLGLDAFFLTKNGQSSLKAQIDGIDCVVALTRHG